MKPIEIEVPVVIENVTGAAHLNVLESDTPDPRKKPEVEPEKLPQEEPGIQPDTKPRKDDDDNDDDDDYEPYEEPEIGDDPDEIKKRTTIM